MTQTNLKSQIRNSDLRSWFLRVAVGTLLLGFAMTASGAAPVAGDQGYGVMLGNPTGLSGKFWFDDRVALDGAFGIDQGKLDAHLSLLFHDNHLLKQLNLQPANSSLVLPVYIGFGPRVLFEDNTEVGMRLPVGVSFFPAASDWEMFAEVAPVVRFTPDTGLDADYAIGARYYFHPIRSQL